MSLYLEYSKNRHTEGHVMMKTNIGVMLPQAMKYYKLENQENILLYSLVKNPTDFILLP
jgi:hypothetical protein